MQEKINVDMFCRKLVPIDLKNLQLRPQKTLGFCVCPEPKRESLSTVDPRYLENDSRYITPEDREKYEKEFEQLMKEKEDKFMFQEFKEPIKNICEYESEFIHKYESEER